MDLRFPHPLQNWLMGIAVFFLPFEQLQFISIICWILLAVWWFFNKSYKEIIPQIKKTPLILLFSGFYIYHVIGMCWSSNMVYGLNDLQTKMSLFFFPIIICTVPLDKNSYRFVSNGFIAGCFAAIIGCLSLAFHDYHISNDISAFYYVRFSHFIHATYFTMYLNLASLLISKKLLEEWDSVSAKRYFYLGLLLLFLLNTMLLSSRTASVVSFISIPVFLLISGKSTLKKTSSFVLPLIVLLFIGITYPGTLHYNNRYQQVEAEVNKIETDKSQQTNSASQSILPTAEGSSFNSTTSRMLLWTYSFNVIKNHPLVGVGTGNLRIELNKEYLRNGWQYGVEKEYSSHNQYLHTGVILGVIGIAILLLSLMLPFFQSVKSKDWLYAGFLFIIIFNNITEDTMEIQKGILFYGFFNSYFLVLGQRKQD